MTETHYDSRVFTTLCEMIEQRNYIIETKFDEDSIPSSIVATKPNGEKVVIFSEIVDKYNIKKFHTTVSHMNEMKIKHGIIVFTSITPATKKKIIDTEAIKLTIESFFEQDLKYNPTKHRLVPQHRQLSPKECQDFKEKYGTKINVIKIDDVISRFYGFQKGDIIEIVRNNGYVNYRIVK